MNEGPGMHGLGYLLDLMLVLQTRISHTDRESTISLSEAESEKRYKKVDRVHDCKDMNSRYAGFTLEGSADEQRYWHLGDPLRGTITR
jgi:hypothetical protein